MRDHLVHHYFDIDHAVVKATVESDLPELELAIQALAETLLPEHRRDEDLPTEPASA